MSVIYEPRGRAREYAALACNIYGGCDHRCVYCYAPDATFKKRLDFANPKPRKNFFAQLEKDALKFANSADRVLLCFTTDPYQSLDVKLAHTRRTIEILHAHNIPIQVLTKGGSRALRDLDLFTDRDAYATTMTLLDPVTSAKWEPGAALPHDRIAAIRQFHAAGIPTWVSLEPVLDPQQSLDIIRQTHQFVDLYKVGTLNHHPHAKTINWPGFAQDVVDLLETVGNPYYIKDDLAKHLLDPHFQSNLRMAA